MHLRDKPPYHLSGGEKKRVATATVLSMLPSILVLDEPTNDLDIDTLELLEQLLQDYKGTVFLVSHDRAFLDNVVTSIIAYEGDGAWREYEGGYEDWKIQKQRTEAYKSTQSNAVQEVKQSASQPTQSSVSQAKSKVQKLNGKERQELESIPAQIETLEHEQADISIKLADPDLYKSQPDQLAKYQARLRDIEEQLITLMARWESLLERSEG